MLNLLCEAFNHVVHIGYESNTPEYSSDAGCQKMIQDAIKRRGFNEVSLQPINICLSPLKAAGGAQGSCAQKLYSPPPWGTCYSRRYHTSGTRGKLRIYIIAQVGFKS